MQIKSSSFLLALALAGCAMQPATLASVPLPEVKSAGGDCGIPEEVWTELRGGYCDLPKDVRDFVARRDICQHFLGEEPYDAERRRYLEEAIRENCSGTEKRYQSLRKRYERDMETKVWLERYIAAFGEPVEP